MTSTDRLVAGVIGALSAPVARLYETNAAFGVVIDCVAFATTMEVIMTTTVAMRMTPGRENFWIPILIAFILFWVFFCVGFFCHSRRRYLNFRAYVDPEMAQPFTESPMKARESLDTLFAVLDGFPFVCWPKTD